MANEVRLIDANALIERHCECCKKEIRECCKTDPVCGSLMWLAEAPTIDPESLRPKGQWTVIEGDYWNEDVIYQCSECKEEFVSFDGTNLEKLWNYCPECGADMREGGE